MKAHARPHHFTTTSLTPTLYIKVPVPRQETEPSCICVLEVSILPLSMMIFECDIVFRHDSVIFFVFHFIPKYIWTNKQKYPFHITFILFEKEQLYLSKLFNKILSYSFYACINSICLYLINY